MLLGLALVSSLVMARWLGPEGRGVFAVVMLLPQLVTTLGLFGFDQANAVYAGLQPHGQRALVWQSVMIAGVAGGLFVFAGVFYLRIGRQDFMRAFAAHTGFTSSLSLVFPLTCSRVTGWPFSGG